MTGSKSNKRALTLGTAGLMLTAVLGACNSGAAPTASPSDVPSDDASDAAAAALPLSTTTPTTVSSAPPVTALPAAPAVPVRHLADRRESYAYLDRAYYQEDAVEDAPPDYTYDDNGVRPWIWSTRDGSRVISEPVAGGYRYYYYQAGADSPYLVRDPRYSYAYDNGALVAVFTVTGQQIDPETSSEQVGYAGRYLYRGQNLYRGSSMYQHVPVNAYAWNDHRADIAAQRAAWHQQINNNPDWSAWNGEHHDQEQRVWIDDRQQHQAAAQQFGTWQQRNFQGQPPQLYTQQNGSGNHTAAIIGGVVAAGLAAVAIHDLTHHDHPNQNQGNNPGNNGAQPQNRGMVPQNNGARPGNYGAGQASAARYGQPRQQPVHPQYAPPTHQVAAPAREGAANPGRPERIMAPHNSQPAPHYAAPQTTARERPEQRPAAGAHVVNQVIERPAARLEQRAAGVPVARVTEVIPRPAPRVEQHPAPGPHPAEAHPGPHDREHEHHDHQ